MSEPAKTTMGTLIAALRKERGMTQAELADKMGVTDKAVSKWERDLSYPDVAALPRLAELFGISVDDLMRARTPQRSEALTQSPRRIVILILKAVALAMGVAVTVLSALDNLDPASGIQLLGIGLACAGMSGVMNETA